MNSPARPALGYPLYAVNRSGYLVVDPRHRLFWQTSGNPAGFPMLVLHGGPGAGSAPDIRCFFDPTQFHLIQIDQRGAGASQPYAEIQENTTQHLVDDLEKLRLHLKISRWGVFGVSWGSALALVYAESYPEHCQALILSGILLGEAAEVQWFLNGAYPFFPQAGQALRDYLPPQGSLLEGYYTRLIDPDPAIHQPAAHSICHYGGSIAAFDDNHVTIQRNIHPSTVLALARISCHYWINHFFLTAGQVLQNAHRLRALPIQLIQGRYDMITPPLAASQLSQQLPQAQLTIVTAGGHSIREPAMRQALLSAIEAFKQQNCSGSY